MDEAQADGVGLDLAGHVAANLATPPSGLGHPAAQTSE